MNWECFVIGLFIGGGVGLIVSALCAAAGRSDKDLEGDNK